MPREPDAPKPGDKTDKLDEETRKSLFGKEDESRSAERKPGKERHYSGPSPSGSGKKPGSTS